MPRPAKKDLDVYQGDDHAWPIAIKRRIDESTTAPYDLTDHTLSAHIREDIADVDDSVDAAFTFDIDPDPTSGEFVMHLSSEDSEALDLTRYKWDLQLTRTVDDYVTTLLYGTVVVSKEVTRP